MSGGAKLVVLLAIATVSILEARELRVVIETIIERGTSQPGLKSEHSLLIDTVDHTVEKLRPVKTGSTTLASFHMPFSGAKATMKVGSVNNKFEEAAQKGESGYTAVEFTGSTQSWVRLTPPIDYRLKLIFRPGKGYVLSGCHDEFPSYRVTIDGREAYYRPHDPQGNVDSWEDIKRIARLLQGCRWKVYEERSLLGSEREARAKRQPTQRPSSRFRDLIGLGRSADSLDQSDEQGPEVADANGQESIDRSEAADRAGGRQQSGREDTEKVSTGADSRRASEIRRHGDAGNRAQRELDKVTSEAREASEALDKALEREMKEMDEEFLIPNPP